MGGVSIIDRDAIIEKIVDNIIVEQEKIIKKRDVLVREGADMYNKLEELKDYVVENL